MKVLVTGATGLVGSHLTEVLVNAGYDVRCLVRQSTNLSVLEGLDVEIFEADIRDTIAVEQAIKGC
jgi:uncharacterized protein YbjT (DUF2867 family)